MASTSSPRAAVSDEELGRLLALMKDSDSVELKVTVPESEQRSAVVSLGMDPLEAQIRQIYFFDTPDLALSGSGVVVRARRVQGKGDDSVVKLRPVVPADLPEDLRRSAGFFVEVDAMPGGFVCSASLRGLPGRPTSGRPSPAACRCGSCSPGSSARSTPHTHPRGSASTTSPSSARSSSSSSG